MKKIHKKIGAMALAGMVVAGGVAASGVSSHAVSYSKLPPVLVSKESLDKLSPLEKLSLQEVQEVCQRVGGKVRVRAVSRSRNAMNEFIKKGDVIQKPQVRKRLLNEVPHYVHGPWALQLELQSSKKRGMKVVRLQYDNLEFLFFL